MLADLTSSRCWQLLDQLEALGQLERREAGPFELLDQVLERELSARLKDHARARSLAQPAIWENFEYLAVLSEDWIRQNTSTYPKGVRRMGVVNPWPVAEARS